MIYLTRYATAVFMVMIFVGCGDFLERTYVLDDFTIDFDARGGSSCASIEAAYGRNVILPASKRPGYFFLGWYSDIGPHGSRVGIGGSGYTMGPKDIKLYARWEHILPIDSVAGNRGKADTVTAGGIVCVWVAPGTFTMGSPDNEDGRHYDETRREVTISKGFWISKYPVTNRQYKELFAGHTFPAGAEEHPVANVTWYDAENFASSAGMSLPTEAQWEFAARGGNVGKNHRYIYSGSSYIDNTAWYAGNAEGKSHKVGIKMPNDLGIYDMSGSVSEWCRDWYGSYDPSDVIDPERTLYSAEGKILRGGGYEGPARDCRVADRAFAHPLETKNDLGFRVVFMESL